MNRKEELIVLIYSTRQMCIEGLVAKRKNAGRELAPKDKDFLDDLNNQYLLFYDEYQTILENEKAV